MAGRAYLVGLGLGLVVLAFAGGTQMPPLATHGDFAEQWAAARVVLEGGDPYDTVTWRADAARLAGRASDSAAFIYPPYVTLALVPLAALPLSAAATLWVVASLVVAALGVGRLLRAFPPHPLVALGVGFSLLASGGALLALAQGQWDLLLVGALSWAIVALGRAGRDASVATLLLAKPQLAPLVLLGLARASTGLARRRYIIGVAASLAFVAATVVRLDWWTEWLQASLRFGGRPPIRTATIATLFEPLGLWSPFAVVVLLAIVVIVSIRSDRTNSLPRWVCAGVLIAPYAQAYDHVLLIAPLVMATAGPAGGRRYVLAALGIVVLVVGDLVIAGMTASEGHDIGGALVPLAIWLIVVVATRTSQSPTNF